MTTIPDSQSRSAPASAPPARERALDAAMRLFHEQGYHATSVSTILREAGLHSGSLYNLFASKEALLEAVLERYIEMLRPVILAPAEKATDDPIGRIFALLGAYRRGLEMTGCALGCPIGNLALEIGPEHERLRALIDRNFANWSGGVRAWLEAGAAQGRIPPDTDLDGLASFILTVMEGGMMQSRAAGSLDPFDTSVAQLRAYFDHLERGAERAPAPERKES